MHSYLQWIEDNIPHQGVFEILSPGNTLKEMAQKFRFYDRYGVEKYYLYDSDKNDLTGGLRSDLGLEVIDEIAGWVSSRLRVGFELTEDELQIYRPDGQWFITYVELARRAEQAEATLEQTEALLEQERQRSQDLEVRLRALGVEPEQLWVKLSS